MSEPSIPHLKEEKEVDDPKESVDKKMLDNRLQDLNENLEASMREKEDILLQGMAIDPEGRRFLCWLTAMSVLAVYSTAVTAYEIAFYDDFRRFHSITCLDLFVDLMFIADVVVQFNTGYFVADIKQMRRDLARRRFQHSGRCWLDLIACAPLDIFQAATGWHPAWRLNKLLRLWSLKVNTSQLLLSTSRPKTIHKIILGRLLLVWLLMPHFAACGRILITYRKNKDDWEPDEDQLDESTFMQYLHSLYWCLGLMTGYADGDIPSTAPQYLFTLSLINLGLFTFAYTVGVLSSIGDSGRDRANDFVVLVNSMRCFLSRHTMPADLEHRITDFMLHRWKIIKANTKELVDAAELLEQLPSCIRFEAVLSLIEDALTKVPLFARVESGFMNALTQKMEAMNASIGEVLIKQGDFSNSMYIVLRGRLDVTVDGNRINTLREGSFFGEQSLLAAKNSESQIEAASFCELYRLRREDFVDLKLNFKDTFNGFAQAAKLEAKKTTKAIKSASRQSASGGSGRCTSTTSSIVTGRRMTIMDGMKGSIRPPAGGPWVLLPASPARAVWAGVVIVALSYECLSLPFKLVFLGNCIYGGATACDALIDTLLLVDMLLNFRLAFLLDGRLISDREQIKKRYLFGGSGDDERMHLSKLQKFKLCFAGEFLPTLIASLPYSVLLVFAMVGADVRLLQAVRGLRILRAVPWFRADHVTHEQPTNLDELLRTVRGSVFNLQAALAKLLPLLCMYLVLAHYIACAYWAIVMVEVPTTGDSPVWKSKDLLDVEENVGSSEWLPSGVYLTDSDLVHYYLRALYWGVVNLTGQGKDLRPLAMGPLMFTCFCFIVGVFVFAYLTAAIVTLVMNADPALVSFQNKNQAVLGFMTTEQVDGSVTRRAQLWLQHFWHLQGGEDLGVVINKLPPSLRFEIRVELFRQATEKKVLFQKLWGLESKLKTVLISDIATSLGISVFNTGEWVLRKGMLNDILFIVSLGKAEVILDDDTGKKFGARKGTMVRGDIKNKAVALLCEGDVFGENSVMYRNKCSASIRAKEPIELLTLGRKVFMRIMQRNDPLLKDFRAIIVARRHENEYYRFGTVTIIKKATNVMMAAARLVRVLKARVKKRRAEGGSLPTLSSSPTTAEPPPVAAERAAPPRQVKIQTFEDDHT